VDDSRVLYLARRSVAVLLFSLLAAFDSKESMTLLDYKVYQSDLDSEAELTAHVGNTPLLPLRRLSRELSPRIKLLAKAEWFNPGGSVKDRPALNIIRTALANGDLGRGKRLLDSTSGNMGISYATFGATLGIPVTLAVPASASSERIAILRALGAELILTDPTEGSDGAILMARQVAAENPDVYWYANQYNNDANWQAHFKSTGPEILCQTDERSRICGWSGHLRHIDRHGPISPRATAAREDHRLPT
jgi:cysteine synthase B